jgi:phosphate transport system substrate-binding protein
MRNKIVITLAVLGLLLAACGPTAAPTRAPATQSTSADSLSGTITVAGSTTVQPLAEELAQAFIAANPDVKIDVQGGGSSVGVKSAGQGTADIGTASREIKDSEKADFPTLKIYTIAIDGIAIVAHPDVGVADLTVEQVRDIFSGKITNWKDVGGADSLIIVVSREEGSGTRGAFEELVMGEEPILDTAILQSSNGAVRTTVSTTPDSIAYLSFGYLDRSVKALMIGGVEATTANVLNKSYPISRPLNMLTNGDPQGAVKAWLDWILGPDGQTIVGQDYIPVQ